MLKHAIMVMGYGNGEILQKTINVLDSDNIDFIIHWDKKYNLPNLTSKNSKIIFLNNRIKVNWGSDAQTIVEKKLFDYVLGLNKYDYVHLISSSDIPLMDSTHFQNFFKKGSYYIGFMDYMEKTTYDLFKGYYPIRHVNVKNKQFLLRIIKCLNKLFKVNRLKNKKIEKGCNWFSMDIDYLKEVVQYPDFNMFLYRFTGDEIYVQTILRRLKPEKMNNKYNLYSDEYRMTNSSEMASRYIDWFRGRPYEFNESDLKELKNEMNTKYSFARKVIDPSIVDKLFNNIE